MKCFQTLKGPGESSRKGYNLDFDLASSFNNFKLQEHLHLYHILTLQMKLKLVFPYIGGCFSDNPNSI